jgi:hypothetical protein
MKQRILKEAQYPTFVREAQYYLPNKDGSIALYYRIAPIQFNDGTIRNQLQYHSTCGGGWMGSLDRNKTELMKRMVKIKWRAQ